MASSQFTIYTSADANAPQLYGTVGSLLDVFDWCLVTGSKWLKPLPNTASGGPIAAFGCYKQPSGSMCTLFINDSGSNATSTFREAWVTGWETLTTMSAPVGTGSGQFPCFGQVLTTGHMVVRKSATADKTVTRPWVMFADPWTFYFFCNPGDASTANYWMGSLFFGDIYSFHGSSDRQKCTIQGRIIENSVSPTTNDYNDMITYAMTAPTIGSGASGYINRNRGNVYLSNLITKIGDFGCAFGGNQGVVYAPMAGMLSGINPGDLSIYLTPIRIWECQGSLGGHLRGRMRGMYHCPVPVTQVSDGTEFGGIGDMIGKTFTIMKQGSNGGFWVIETSPTLETN